MRNLYWGIITIILLTLLGHSCGDTFAYHRTLTEALALAKTQQGEIQALQNSLDTVLTTCSAEQQRFESCLAELGNNYPGETYP